MNSLWNERVLVQLRGNVLGPFPVSDLRRLSGFTPRTLISFAGSEKWAPAFRILGEKILFDGPLNISPDKEGPLPPIDAFSSVFFAPKDSARARISDFVAPDIRQGLADRWFRRLVFFNFVLGLAIYAAWSCPPLQASLRDHLHVATHQLQDRLTPMLGRLKQQCDLPSRTRDLRLVLQDLTKVKSDFLDAFKTR